MSKQPFKTCLECGEKIRGRSDKKFCSDLCRGNFNNKRLGESLLYVRRVNSILLKNKRILDYMASHAHAVLPIGLAKEMGFSEGFHTGNSQKAGIQLFHLYDRRYFIDDEGIHLAQ